MASEAIRSRPREASPPSRFRVLVGSQDPLVHRLLEGGLPAGAFEILLPPAARGVVEAVVDQSPDLLILDIDWEGGAPAEAVRMLRKLRPALRIIALSAESSSRDAEVVSEGVFYYTVKPVGEDLIEVIQAAAHPHSGRPGGEDR